MYILSAKNMHNISIPCAYFSAYWPNTVHLTNEPASIVKEFPFGIQSKLYELAKDINIPENDVLAAMRDPYLVQDSDIELSYSSACAPLQQRENDNNVDIPLKQYIVDNLKSTQLFNTVAHRLLNGEYM
jgi:hypothetical protein